jgi:hypothetical protein
LTDRVMCSGLIRLANQELVDEYAGRSFTRMLQVECESVRPVSLVHDCFFMVRREHLLAVGGMSLLCSAAVNRVPNELCSWAQRNNGQAFVTSKAVAKFEVDRPGLLRSNG